MKSFGHAVIDRQNREYPVNRAVSIANYSTPEVRKMMRRGARNAAQGARWTGSALCVIAAYRAELARKFNRWGGL